MYKKKPQKKGGSYNRNSDQEEQVVRVRMPRPPEVFGLLEQRLGASRLRVKCFDSKTRVCRIPGRLKRRLWVREGDIVIIEPWEFGGDDKGDVIYKYTKNQVQFLKNKGYLKQIEDFEDL
ncbi:MAG: translation initiation factor eIF-1A [Candidatus Woesearchaeota archaeon]